jgi:hypothetical protein
MYYATLAGVFSRRGPKHLAEDVFKMSGRTTLDIDGAELFVAVFPTVYSTRAAFADELPEDYEESCIQVTDEHGGVLGDRPAVR